MNDPDATMAPGKRKPELVQTKITSSFSTPRRSHTASGPASQIISESQTGAAAEEEEEQEEDRMNTIKSLLNPERRSNLPRPPQTRKEILTKTATETKKVLPHILKTRPDAPPTGHLYTSKKTAPLNPKKCPNLPKTPIRVLNSDTIDAALSLSSSSSTAPSKPVLILNMANALHRGGGWRDGCLAQEEALCYRSSLSFTLKAPYYPIPEAGGIYSATVVVIRERMANGHALLDLTRPEDLPVISVVSVAALCTPRIVKDANGKETYRNPKKREVMKEKMRMVLRIAGWNGHRVLVLGALGCGAFGNPRGEVVNCWKEVFAETEFSGGWWERVVFAVMEPGETTEGHGNFGGFSRELNDVMV